MVRVKLKRDFSKHNLLFTRGAIGESDMRPHCKHPWGHIKFIDVAIGGDHLDVVDDWSVIEVIDERYWEQLLMKLRICESIILTVGADGNPKSLVCQSTNLSKAKCDEIRDKEKIRRMIDLCDKNSVPYEINPQ